MMLGCLRGIIRSCYDNEACAAEDCEGGVGGACDGAVVPGLTADNGAVAAGVASGDCEDTCSGLWFSWHSRRL